MKKNDRISRVAAGVKKHSVTANGPSFEQFADVATELVEHRTIFDFLRLIHHPWQPDEVERFGNKVKRMADAIPLAWVTMPHAELGILRVYPLPFMQWIYSTMAKQFAWPMPALALEEGKREQREELRRHEGARKHLEAAVGHTPTPAVSEALAIVLTWLEGETKRLRGEVEPLKAVATAPAKS